MWHWQHPPYFTSQWILHVFLYYWLSFQDKLKYLRCLVAVFHQPLISQVEKSKRSFFKVWIHDISVRIRVEMVLMSILLLKILLLWKISNIHKIRGNSTVDPWTKQELGVLTPQQSKIRVWLLTPQNFTNSLLLTGHLTNNAQADEHIFSTLYVLYTALK